MVLGALSFSFVNQKYQYNINFFFLCNIRAKIDAYNETEEIINEVDSPLARH